MDIVYPLVTAAFFLSAWLLLYLCQALGGNP